MDALSDERKNCFAPHLHPFIYAYGNDGITCNIRRIYELCSMYYFSNSLLVKERGRNINMYTDSFIDKFYRGATGYMQECKDLWIYNSSENGYKGKNRI